MSNNATLWHCARVQQIRKYNCALTPVDSAPSMVQDALVKYPAQTSTCTWAQRARNGACVARLARTTGAEGVYIHTPIP